MKNMINFSKYNSQRKIMMDFSKLNATKKKKKKKQKFAIL